jgi:CzcA family heavy metal efflux pump
MFKALIALSLRHSSLVTVLAGLSLLGAGLLLPRMPVDVFPELNAPTVTIMTEAGGLSADEVELYATVPIESAVNGLPGVRRVRSASAISLSIVWVEFEWGADLHRARQLVAERLDAARRDLPEAVKPEIAPISSITGEVMLIALSSPDGQVGPLELRGFAEFELRNRLLAIPGIAQVVAIGGAMPQFRIDCRSDRLALSGLSILDVAAAAARAHSTAPAGYLPSVEFRELPLRQRARIEGVESIANTLVEMRDGLPLRIGDIAEVSLSAAPRRGSASDGGVPAVILSLQKSPGVNTLALTAEIDAALEEIAAALPEGVVLNRAVFRASDFIERSLRNLLVVLRDAAVIVAVIVALFLLNARTTLITLLAIPISLALAIATLWALGLSLNAMTLGGLAVAVGELVDDAIIDVENVWRRLRENALRPAAERRGFVETVFEASNEIRSSVVFATTIICMVFVPLLFLQGLEGRFFRPLGIAYIVAIVASLLVALTVTPALCRLLLGRSLAASAARGTAAHADGPLVRVLKRLYLPSLRWSVRHRGLVLGGAAAATAASLILGSTFGSSFLPRFNEGTLTVFVMAPPGTSLEESDRIAGHLERQMLPIEGVRGVSRRTGRAERDEHAEPVSMSEIEVTLRPDADESAVRGAVDRVLATVPGISTSVGQPIEHRLSHILSGTPAAIAISIFGEDLAQLRELAREVEAALREVPGTRDVAANREVLVRTVPIRYRAADLAAAGLNPADAAEQVEAALHGRVVASVHLGRRRYEVVVGLAAEERERIEQVAELQLRGAGGALVRLREVADLGVEEASNLIAREGGERRALVTANLAEGANLGDLVPLVQAAVDPIVRQAGCRVRYGGTFEAQQGAARTILWMGLGVLVAMLLLLRAATESFRLALMTMLNLPLALIGGVAAIFIADSHDPIANLAALAGIGGGEYLPPVVSIASLVGFVTLFGIAARNGILLVNHYRHLQQFESAGAAEAIERGSMERLVPILMTALTAAIGMLPLALAAGMPGSELIAPLAVVVLGGLVTSTFLNLVVVPAAATLVLRDPPAESSS